MKPQPTSVLEQCIQGIYQSRTLEEGKVLMKELIESTNIKSTDKNKMLNELENISTLARLQFYATNAMFKFEGLGVNGRTVIKK